MTLLTVGHGTASQAELTGLLRAAAVELVVDVRTAPGSRRHGVRVRPDGLLVYDAGTLRE